MLELCQWTPGSGHSLIQIHTLCVFTKTWIQLWRCSWCCLCLSVSTRPSSRLLQRNHSFASLSNSFSFILSFLFVFLFLFRLFLISTALHHSEEPRAQDARCCAFTQNGPKWQNLRRPSGRIYGLFITSFCCMWFQTECLVSPLIFIQHFHNALILFHMDISLIVHEGF